MERGPAVLETRYPHEMHSRRRRAGSDQAVACPQRGVARAAEAVRRATLGQIRLAGLLDGKACHRCSSTGVRGKLGRPPIDPAALADSRTFRNLDIARMHESGTENHAGSVISSGAPLVAAITLAPGTRPDLAPPAGISPRAGSALCLPRGSALGRDRLQVDRADLARASRLGPDLGRRDGPVAEALDHGCFAGVKPAAADSDAITDRESGPAGPCREVDRDDRRANIRLAGKSRRRSRPVGCSGRRVGDLALAGRHLAHPPRPRRRRPAPGVLCHSSLDDAAITRSPGSRQCTAVARDANATLPVANPGRFVRTWAAGCEPGPPAR